MKSVIVRSLIAVLFCVCVRFTLAGDFHSVVVPSATPLAITIPDQHFIRIRNFTQDVAFPPRGTVSVKLGTGAIPINVMTASFVNPNATVTQIEPINSVVIAGPATVTITAAAGTNTVVTYIKQHDSD
jgi:hypothetical protein